LSVEEELKKIEAACIGQMHGLCKCRSGELFGLVLQGEKMLAYVLAVVLIDASGVLLAWAIYKYSRSHSHMISSLADCCADCIGKRAVAEGYDPDDMPDDVYFRLHSECWAKCLNPQQTIKILDKRPKKHA
jgi:hypothetical protein